MPTDNEHHELPDPLCPRCGYDLSVTVQQWPDDRCPLTDTCTECGLTVEWRKVLGDERIPKWILEHNPRRVRTWLSSALVPLVPWKAMREADMAYSVRFRTLCVAAAVWVAVFYFAVVATIATVRGFGYGWSYFAWADAGEAFAWPASIPDVVAQVPRQSRGRGWWGPRTIQLVTGVQLLMLFVTTVQAASFLLMGDTFAKLKIQKRHIARLWGLAVVSLLALSAVLPVLRGLFFLLDEKNLLPRVVSGTVDLLDDPDGAVRIFGVFALWSCVYWWAACRWYLKVRWALFHSLLLGVIAWLLLLAVVFYAGMLFAD